MFQKIRTRLWLNNLLVFVLVLSSTAAVVRFVFVQNLKAETTARLIAIGLGIASEAEINESGQLEIEDEFIAIAPSYQGQAFEWFTIQGTLADKVGDFFPETLFNAEETTGFEGQGKQQIRFVTLPVIDDDNIDEQIGYIRISQRMSDAEETMRQLDIGLGAGVIVGTLLASIGIIWLNKQTMQPIEESFQRLRQFTADASHELRNPLMAISSNAEVALKYSKGMRPDDRDAIVAMLSATKQMTRLTEDLLLLARTDRVSTIPLEPLNLSTLIETLVKLYRPQAEKKDILLIEKIPPNLSLQGNRNGLIRAFTNLLQNSIRYTPQGGRVDISVREGGNRLQVVVKDTGIGIAQDNLNKVFERFWQADQARKYDSGSSGLGLSITQAIIDSHNGSIEVTSDVGKGTCFVINLPSALR
ncbi:MAG: HAMP domain-containing sensor histidine kinase [Cyanobacteria bacterium J06649_4]